LVRFIITGGIAGYNMWGVSVIEIGIIGTSILILFYLSFLKNAIRFVV